MIGRFYSRFVFPYLADIALSMPQIASRRKSALENAHGAILEIGFGTGLNLPHYPPGVSKIVTVEPNDGMNRLARRRILESAIHVEPNIAVGELLPFGDAEFDSVVCTWTLCSVSDTAAVMSEASRVLKRGGKFFFLEHGLADDPKTQKWQNRLTPLNRIVADGCHLNRDMPAIIQSGGLKIVRLEKSRMDNAPGIVGNIYMGVAEKV